MAENIITIRTNNLKEIYNKYNNKNNKMHQLVLLLIDKLNSITIDDAELMKYYKDLCEEIILLIYNKTETYDKNIIM
jgi:predicted GTPase